MTFTVAILAKNEAATLPGVIEGLLEHRDSLAEIMVLDGHSTDGTRELVASYDGLRYELDNGRGKGAAIRQAFGLARGDVVITIDADGSHTATEIPAFIEAFEDPAVMLATGSRVRGGSDEWHGDLEKFLRMTGSGIITWAINTRFNVSLTDSQNGYRAIRRDFARQLPLREDIFTIEQEMIMQTLLHGGKIVEVPTHEYSRAAGESHIVLWRVWWRYIWVTLRCLALRRKPPIRLPE